MGFNREFEINESQIADFLQTATEKVRTEEDVEILNDLHKLFKKDVPLTVRKYVIAYMLKESLKHYRFYGNKRGNYNDRMERNSRSHDVKNTRKERNDFTAQAPVAETATEDRPRHPRVEIAPEDATSIFIGIGKNRKVYPRDLVGILIAIAGIDRERIGDIKVLANYSFVQLYTEDAQTAINKLNGYDYRGRKLAVSYSRQKSDGEGDEVEGSSSVADNGATSKAASTTVPSGFGGDSITDAQMAAEDAAAYAAAEKAAADKEPFGL